MTDALPPSPGQDVTGAAFARLRVAKLNRALHVTLPEGKADGTAVRELYELSAQLLTHDHPHLVIDFAGVGFVSSGMMGMLITVKKKLMGTGGQCLVVVDNDLVRSAFTTMRLERILSLHTTLADALACIKH